VNISPETAKRMKAYFDRHEVDKQGKGWSPGEDGFPSNGRIAWALWGSDPGWAWSRKLVEQINAADKERNAPMEIERRWISHEEVEEGGVPSLRIETRADGSTSRDWIVGYAAKFGVNSLDMGDFIERIDPGAFSIVAERRGRKRPLETRALFNHDPNHVLGRFPTTLRMTVDEVGLRYEVLPPESRQDIVESIRRGDISGSSFSFVIAQNGEKWSMEDGRSIRTITSVSALYDVGPVTFPAYPDSDVSVAKRSYDQFMRSVARRSEADKYVESRRRQAANDIQSFLRERGR
jgi:HK97 family phage prohead protease